ncbi:hypothetical protein DL89DRAFT_47974 [Linderina pennispora]|uniref:Glycoside hydrolase family 38 central domain-containing protein n=1 Tax=Linderina pennispora TaxID=61395 RepID=A0A1Y1W2I8_9FUNG|nr:uncharacterized protein DL89DRAFT_47974 [Linderina pennispora]ORX67622.1 hypothetical protein DL89DRAFT_47974 [Linderina pennispora]
MLVPRRYLRRGTVLLGTLMLWILVLSNTQVLPFGKPAWAPWFGEPMPPTMRDTAVPALPQQLTLHIVPHSHSDIGWNLSFRQYYDKSVHQVMRSVVQELFADNKRRFIWGDLAFVDMWMDEEGDQRSTVGNLTWRQALGELVRRGQWEFVGGTYVSPDEGLATWWAHNSIVDVGRRALQQQLNASASIGWQIDNFGHMQSMAYLLAGFGYRKLVMGRMAYRDQYEFARNAGLQFLWRSERHPEQPAVLTHFLSVHYAAPSSNFDFDNTEECNVVELAEELRRFAMRQVRQYPGHGHVLVMMGDDFRYVRAARAFQCLDKLLAYIGSTERGAWQAINAQYSTMTEYFAAIDPHLQRERGQLQEFSGDMYPYQDKPYEQYWSGMLTTRPYLKWLVRDTEQIVQHAEVLLAMARLRNALSDAWMELEQQMEFARKQVAIGYHHDAITGTCTDAAFHDYVSRLKRAARVALLAGQHALALASGQDLQAKTVRESLMAARSKQTEPVAYNTAARRAQELDALGESRQRALLEVPRRVCSDAGCMQQITVTNANALEPQDSVVRLLVHTRKIAVVDDAGRPVAVEVVANDARDAFVAEFVARNVPAFGLRSYMLTGGSAVSGERAEPQRHLHAAVLDKGNVRVRLAATRDRRIRIAVMQDGVEHVVVHGLREYFANPHVQASGAYIMHSFMLMYALVFYVAGGCLSAGLAVAVLINSDWLADSRLAGLVPQTVRVPGLFAANATAKSPQMPYGSGSRSPTAVASSPEPYDRLVSWRSDEGTVEPEDPPKGRLVRALPMALGGVLGLWFTYFAAQVCSISLLTQWTQGERLVWLVAPAFLVGYLLAGVQRWQIRQCILCIYGVALATVLAMFLRPAWHSRPLAAQNLEFELHRGKLCDTAYVQVDERTRLSYRLCGDSPMLQSTAVLTAKDNREVIAQFELQGAGPLDDLLGCRFETYDGVDVVMRRYRRFAPIPGNYYPAVSHVGLPGRLALHARQAMGVTCPSPNTLETMLHRSMTGNDFRGMSVPLTDHTPAAVSHFLDLQPDMAARRNVLLNSPMLVFLSPARTEQQRLALGMLAPLASAVEGLRMVGVRAELQTGSLDVLVRLQAIAGYTVDVPASILANATGVLRVYGDWALAGAAGKRQEMVDRIVLASGQQALFRFVLKR